MPKFSITSQALDIFCTQIFVPLFAILRRTLCDLPYFLIDRLCVASVIIITIIVTNYYYVRECGSDIMCTRIISRNGVEVCIIIKHYIFLYIIN